MQFQCVVSHFGSFPQFTRENLPSLGRFYDPFTNCALNLYEEVYTVIGAAESIMLCTQIGNTDNVVKLLNEYRLKKYVSSQLFPEATMSSASTAINIKYKIKGGNLTFNTNGHLADALLLAHLECEKLNAPVDLLFGEYGEISQHVNLTQEILFFRVSKRSLVLAAHILIERRGRSISL